MDTKLLLVKAATLLYRESLITGKTDNSAELVRTVIESIKLTEVNIGVNHDRDILAALKQTALEMCANPQDHIYEKGELLQRLKLNTGEDEKLYEGFLQGIEPELNESSLKRTVVNIRKTINNHFREQKIEELLSKASYAFKHNRDKIKNVNQWVSTVVGQLEPFQLDSSSKDPAIISEIDTKNTKDVEGVFDSIKDASEGVSIMKTGWQCINRMLQGGFRRGEQWVIGALQHKWKTGFSLSLFMQFALYNTPIMKDPTKKPLLLRISFEDALLLNFQFLYQALKENETGQSPNIKGLSSEEMAEYVQKKLAVNGYHTYFMHVNPSLWSYKDVCNKIIELEADGYEVHVCMLDYLLKLPTTGCDQGSPGYDIRNMYERTRNFMNAKDILMITPHQLAPSAKMRVREGSPDFVKSLVGEGHYSGCTQLDQVVDGELFIHIEIEGKASYLTIQRGKHRIIEQAPIRDLYSVLKFEQVCIPDDINKADSSRKKVGHGLASSNDSVPFWDTNPI